MSRKRRIKELEAELRVVYNTLYAIDSKSKLHARYNNFFARYLEILEELERISIKWKLKKLFRRI